MSSTSTFIAWATIGKDGDILFSGGENLEIKSDTIQVTLSNTGQYEIYFYLRRGLIDKPSIQITPYCEDDNFDGGPSTDNVFTVATIDANYRRADILKFFVLSKDVAGQANWKYQNAPFSLQVIGSYL